MKLKTLYELAKKKTILLVEDDISLLTQMKEILEEIYINVEVATNGKEGYEKYLDAIKEDKNYYDLIITDIQMPKMNGIELVKAIYEQNPDQIITVISAHTDREYLIDLINIGVFRFIIKPLEYDQLIETLYKAFKSLNLSDAISNDQASEKEKIFLNNDYIWDRKNNLLYSDTNENIKLSKKERAFLKLLLNSSKKIFSHDEIISIVWENEQEDVNKEKVKFLVNRIRKKLPQNTLESIYGLGYRIPTKNLP